MRPAGFQVGGAAWNDVFIVRFAIRGESVLALETLERFDLSGINSPLRRRPKDYRFAQRDRATSHFQRCGPRLVFISQVEQDPTDPLIQDFPLHLPEASCPFPK